MIEYFPHFVLICFLIWGLFTLYDTLKFHIFSEVAKGVIRKIKRPVYYFGEIGHDYTHTIEIEFETKANQKIKSNISQKSLTTELRKGNEIIVYYLSYAPNQFVIKIPNLVLGLVAGLGLVCLGVFLFVLISNRLI